MSLHRDAPFDAPWQARAFALAEGAIHAGAVGREAFRDALKAQIAARPDRPYWESWLAALEGVLARAGVGADDSGMVAPRPAAPRST